MEYAPANVLRWLLVALGAAADPTVTDGGSPPLPTGAWPAYHNNEPNLPDECLTLYDTEGESNGRNMSGGKVIYHYGCQLRVRSLDPKDGFDKAKTLRDVLSQQVYANTVDVPADATHPANAYYLHCCSGFGQIVTLGQDTPGSKRFVHTLNFFIALGI